MAEKSSERQRFLWRRRQRRARERDAAGVRRNQVRILQLEESSTRYDPLARPSLALNIPGPKHGLKIAVITDAQVRKGVPINHLVACANYLTEIRPDVIVNIGDFADMPSLSTYSPAGSLEKETARYRDDVAAVKGAMAAFLTPIRKVRGWNPKLIFTLGNHEDRITRTVELNPHHLQGIMSVDDLGYREAGWTVYPFLQPVVIGGVAFCHYFPSGVLGRPITAAAALLAKMHMSCFAGHLQGRDIAYGKRADGKSLTAIISGSFYQHDETYLSPLANCHFRGMYVLHEVQDGQYDEMAVSISYLLRKFG